MTANNRFYSLERLNRRRRLSHAFYPHKSAQLKPSRIVTRVFDICFSLLVLALGCPVYLVLAACVYLSSPGPIFFSHQRVGRNRRSFGCIKFRTMVPNADKRLRELLEKSPQMRQEFEETFKLKNDPRITWIGKFLRVSSLDELPQFVNVLKGEMSVVGPRPLVKDELPRYGEEIDYVLSVKPGVTGLWQVSGRNDISYEDRVKLDVSYVEKRSLSLDIKLVLKTVGVIVLPKNNGAY